MKELRGLDCRRLEDEEGLEVETMIKADVVSKYLRNREKPQASI